MYLFTCCANESDNGHAWQLVDIRQYATQIDSGNVAAYFGGKMRDWNGSDIAEIAIEFINAQGSVIATSERLTNQSATWTKISRLAAVPSGSREIRFNLYGTRKNGTYNDSYFDDLTLKLEQASECPTIEG
ncbi:hypothetical protein [Aliikangiella maris]|uniref:Uncharacterized protein n=2 Tax=Aliikangiella maris TaxID=3162458 RepID=A0ABV2BU21_9GAMM